MWFPVCDATPSFLTSGLGEMTILFIVFIFLLQLTSRVAARGNCDPLVPEYCYFPFPNSYYTLPSAKTSTGLVVNIPSHTLPIDILGRYIYTEEWNKFDGFSLFPSILTYFPKLSDAYLPKPWNIKYSLTGQSATILLNLKTGELVPHFAELDSTNRALAKNNNSALMIWPAVSLNHSTQYLVALRNLRTINSDPVQPSHAFLALRNNILTNDPDIEYRRVQFEKFFDILSSLDINRRELQLMWDFTTASAESLSGRLLHMRDDAFLRVGPGGPSYVINEVNDNYSNFIYRRVRAEMNIPVYLNSPFPGSHLVIDEQGLPVYQSMEPAQFTVLVPHSVANGTIKDTAIVQYGHGLFASEREVETDYLMKQANHYGYILFACTLWGMADVDLPALVYTVSENVSNIRILPDRISQGIVNQLLLMRLMKGDFSKDPLMKFEGREVINPSESYFYGVSVGGVEGVVYMALTTDVKRGVLGVPGGPFGLLLPRSTDFEQFETILRLFYPDPVDFTVLISLLNMIWSRAEPNAYMAYITKENFPRTPLHHVLYQYGLGDAQVNILGLYSIARSAGAKMFSSNVRERFSPSPYSDVFIVEELFGFEFIPSDEAVIEQESVAVGFDCGAPPEPMKNIPPNSKTDTHEKPRRAKLAQEQFDLFIRTGNVHNFCNGPCNDCSEP